MLDELMARSMPNNFLRANSGDSEETNLQGEALAKFQLDKTVARVDTEISISLAKMFLGSLKENGR